ncbi:MAG: GNAT family N-acetyltransferase [Bdellovibrionales bacterium]|nr:GNAT family N-acetyltransferase [Bdellovibrionales bacterium]
MEGPRPLHEHEMGDFVQFLSTQLRPQSGWSIAEEYPLAIHFSNLNNVRVIRETDGNFLSAAVMKPLIIKCPAGLFKAAAIGSVVTSPDHRNKGLSTKVLEACIEAGRDHGCDFAILWTNLYDFYRKIGFELGGVEVSLSIPENIQADPAGLRFMQSNRVDPEAILRLYSQHTTGSIRTGEDIRKFLQIPNSRVYTAWDAENKLQAYAVEGKGADLDGYIHEWGGGVSKLLPLLQFAVKSSKRPLHLISPSHAQNFIRQLKEAGATEHSGVLGMIKILNAPNFLLKIKKYARAMNAEDTVLEPRDGKYYLGYKSEIFSTDAEADLVRLIFGPLKASQLHPFDKETSETFEKIFPIPMWVWGWDSV